jgi:RNA polymerase sigma-B factor
MNPNSASHAQQGHINQILEYQQTKCQAIATELLLRYQPMVKMAASKISKNRPDLFEDLFQVGQMALLRLFEQFDSLLGIQFEPYAMKSLIVISRGMCKCLDESKRRAPRFRRPLMN